MDFVLQRLQLGSQGLQFYGELLDRSGLGVGLAIACLNLALEREDQCLLLKEPSLEPSNIVLTLGELFLEPLQLGFEVLDRNGSLCPFRVWYGTSVSVCARGARYSDASAPPVGSVKKVQSK
jgi:hypothetical protein